MPIPRSLRRWLRLPGRVALILGLGALSTAGARADTLDQAHRTSFDDILIRSEGGKIYLTEGGRESELQLTATPQRDHLLRLLEEHGPGGVKLDRDPRLIMSSGGGSGFYWWGTRKPAPVKPAPALQNAPQAPTQPRPDPEAYPGSAPRGNYPPIDRKG
jgi:hypothetical protein